jgi:alpha-acetolactate decarboxylase
MAALLDGIYDGDVTIAELLTHGDFGLGTFNHLDGEMVVLDGICHHLRSDGSACVASAGDRTPFAAVINQSPTHGGHSLDFALDDGEIAISTSSELHLGLPRTEAFLKAHMSLADVAQQIQQTEGG